MALSFTTTMTGGSSDYLRYLDGPPVKTHQYNNSILLDFTLAPIDSAFVPLTRGAYIVLNTVTYPKWFTGYVTSDPERVYLGTKNNAPKWGYKIQATSDDYILNLSTIGILPPFIGTTMGAVIQTLAELLAPGVFNFSNVDSGLTLATYNITPDKRFADVIKDFNESANYTFYANDHKLYFKQQDYPTSPLTIDGSSKHFTPGNLQIKPSLNQIVNDVVVVGDVEPQAYVTEYIVGNGFDANFPLLTGVYGADKYQMINETFSGSSIDAQTWVVNDNVNNWLQLYNGYLNVLGGSLNNSFDISLQSLYPVPMEGTVRITHGEWDFLPVTETNVVDGVIGGLWTQAVNSSLTGCVFGINVLRNGGGTLVIQPIINGVPDNTQYMTPATDGSKRYVLRTIVTFNRLHRDPQALNYRNVHGGIRGVTGTPQGDTAFFQTYVNEIDTTTGLLTNSIKWQNDNVAISSSHTYATYAPVVSNNLHVTVSGIAVSFPLQSSLDKAKIIAFDNSNFDKWNDPAYPSSWDFLNSVSEESSDVVSGSALKLTSTTSPALTAFASRYANTQLLGGVKYWVSAKVKISSGFTGSVTIDLNDNSGTVTPSAGVTVAHGSLSSSQYTSVHGVLTTAMAGTTLPGTLILRVYITSNTTTPPGSYILVDDLVIYSDWEALEIGPNDINSLDGTVTTATITSNNNAPQTASLTGAPTYNPGASSLVFFKDTAQQTATTPQPNELYRLTYRSAANCYGRTQNKTSVATEAATWGDFGVRSLIKQDAKPRPRNSAECESTAASIVGQDGYQHYEGSYTQWSTYTNGEPVAGTILLFTNLPSGMPSVEAEEIHQVTTTFVSSKPHELFSHVVSFGEPDYVRRALAKFASDKGSFAEYVSGQQNTTQVLDLSNVGVSFAPDVVEPLLTAWDSANFTIDCNQAAPSGGGFEVRTTDLGWGSDTGNNFVARVTSGTEFTITRQDKTKVVFIKAYDIRNKLLYSEDQSQSNYGVSGSAVVTMFQATNPDNRRSLIASVAMPNTSALFASTSASIAIAAQISGSLSIKGVGASVGKTMQLRLIVATGANIVTSQNITLSAGWQRFTLSGTSTWAGQVYLEVVNAAGVSVSIYTTRWSVEFASLIETAYAKTLSTTYGAVSRFPAIVKIAFPPTDGPVGTFSDSTLEVDALHLSQFVSPPSQVVTLTSSSIIVPDAFIKSITSAADLTLSTLPVINGGIDGQQLQLLNVGSHTITIPCGGTLSGSSLATSTDVVLEPNGMFSLMYLSGTGWIQFGDGSGGSTSGYTITRYI